jgi:hypothetical protein
MISANMLILERHNTMIRFEDVPGLTLHYPRRHDFDWTVPFVTFGGVTHPDVYFSWTWGESDDNLFVNCRIENGMVVGPVDPSKPMRAPRGWWP